MTEKRQAVAATFEEVTSGIESSITGNTLTLRIKLDTKGTASNSGKTVINASSHGNVSIPGTDMKMGLNIYTKI